MFESTVRTITSYNYSSDLYYRTLKKKIIIYGAGPEGNAVKNSLVKAGVCPLFFWDMNPNAKIEGFDVRQPDLGSIPKDERKDYLVIVALELSLRGFYSVNKRLVEYGYTEYIHAPALREHLDAMNCFLYGSGIENCKRCRLLHTQCFCINDKYLGKPFDKDKLLMPCLLTIEYNNKEDVTNAAKRCEKFCNYFSSTQSVIIIYNPLCDCDDEIYLLTKHLIERVNVGIVAILCEKTDVASDYLLDKLSFCKSRINFLVDTKNTQMMNALDNKEITYVIAENVGFDAESLYDRRVQCFGCTHKTFYCLGSGGKIGFRCRNNVEIPRSYGIENTIDIDEETSNPSPDFARKLDSIRAGVFSSGKCDRKIFISEGWV